MRKSQVTEAQIILILQETAAGATIDEVCRRHGIAAKTYGSSTRADSRSARPKSSRGAVPVHRVRAGRDVRNLLSRESR